MQVFLLKKRESWLFKCINIINCIFWLQLMARKAGGIYWGWYVTLLCKTSEGANSRNNSISVTIPLLQVYELQAVLNVWQELSPEELQKFIPHCTAITEEQSMWLQHVLIIFAFSLQSWWKFLFSFKESLDEISSLQSRNRKKDTVA